MTDRSTGPRCGNNPNTRLTPGDRKAVDDFKARLALQADAKPYIERAAWVDFDPLMEVIAATVWEHCARDDEDMPQLVRDDPRTIAAFAAAVARAHAAVAAPATDQPGPSRRAGLRDELVNALGQIKTVPPVAHRREQADHVLAVLYREWPWLRAEAENAADQAALRDRIAEALYEARKNGLGGMSESAAVTYMANAVVRKLPAPADRAAVLDQAAAGFDRHAEQLLTGVGGKAVFVAKALRDQAAVWSEAAETLRRMAAEARGNDEQRDSRCTECRHWICDGDGPCGAILSVGVISEKRCTCTGPAAAVVRAAEPADTETVHGCPPDGSGLTPCCGRTPFELPPTDRISSEAPVTCCGAAEAQQDGAQQ